MSTHHTESKPRKRDKFKNFFRKITGRSRAASRGNAPEPVSSSSRNSAASQPGGPPQRGNDLPASSSIPITGPGDHSVHIYGGNTLPSQGGAVTAAPDPSPSTLPASAPTSSNIVRNEDRPPGSSTSPSALPASQPTSSNDPVHDENRSPGASPSAPPVVTVTASEPTSSNNARDEGPPRGSSPSALPVAEPTTSNDGARDGDRDRSRIAANLAGPAKLAWHGLQLFLKKAETSLDGTPAKLPVGLLNRLIEIGTAVSANKEDIRELFSRTKSRLEMLNDALLSVRDDDVGKDRIEKFAGLLIPQLEKLDKMERRHLGIRVVESDEDKVKVKEIFKRLDKCAKDFHMDISLSIERKTTAVFNSLQKLHLDSWPRSRQAVYNADLDSTTLTRQPCTPGTRTAIIDAILEWAKDSTSAPVYWLNGMAGTGKSTIAYSICQRVEEMGQDNRDVILAASFFCSRQIEDARRRKYIIPTIVYQLARHSRSYAEKLLNADFDTVDVSSRQMKELLIGPWDKSVSKRPSDIPPRLVIVDALDENDGGSQFLKDLLDMVEEGHLQGLKFLVTSRPDPKIVAYCNGFQPEVVCHLHEVKPEDVQSDILTFMMVSLPTLSDKPQLKELGRQAGGLFIYAATAVRFISPATLTPREQKKRLDTLLNAWPTLSESVEALLVDQLYSQILQVTLLSLGESIQCAHLAIIHTILCAEEPVSPVVVSALLSDLDIDEDMVKDVVGNLHAVLYVSKHDGCIYWYHQSFFDFMCDSQR